MGPKGKPPISFGVPLEGKLAVLDLGKYATVLYNLREPQG